jgi:hypothetical protein
MMSFTANYGKKIIMWNVKKISFIIKLLLFFFSVYTMHTKKIIQICQGFCVMTKSHIMKTFCSYWYWIFSSIVHKWFFLSKQWTFWWSLIFKLQLQNTMHIMCGKDIILKYRYFSYYMIVVMRKDELQFHIITLSS